MKLLVSLAAVLVVAANPVIAQCDYDFCSGGIKYPDAIVNPKEPVNDQADCALVDLGITSGQVTPEQCEELPGAELICCPPSGPYDCGNTTVDFCPNGLDNPNLIVNPSDPVEEQIPCSFVIATLILGAVPEEDCAMIPFGEFVCCPPLIESPNENVTAPPVDDNNSTLPPTAPETTEAPCKVCGSDVKWNKEKSWAGVDVCAQLAEIVADLPAGDFCNKMVEETMADEGIDLRSYCECEGSVAADVCKVCPAGKELAGLKEIPGANGRTCGTWADYVAHVYDESMCGQHVTSEAQDICCETPERGGGGAKGGKPTSSGMNLTFRSLASALLLVLAFATI